MRYSDFRFCSTSLMKLRLILYFARSASRWRTNSALRLQRAVSLYRHVEAFMAYYHEGSPEVLFYCTARVAVLDV